MASQVSGSHRSTGDLTPRSLTSRDPVAHHFSKALESLTLPAGPAAYGTAVVPKSKLSSSQSGSVALRDDDASAPHSKVQSAAMSIHSSLTVKTGDADLPEIDMRSEKALSLNLGDHLQKQPSEMRVQARSASPRLGGSRSVPTPDDNLGTESRPIIKSAQFSARVSQSKRSSTASETRSKSPSAHSRQFVTPRSQHFLGGLSSTESQAGRSSGDGLKMSSTPRPLASSIDLLHQG